MATSGYFYTGYAKDSGGTTPRRYKFEWEQDSTNPLRINWSFSSEGTAADGTTAWTLRGMTLTVDTTNCKIASTYSVVNPSADLWNVKDSSIYANTAKNTLPSTSATLHGFTNSYSNGGPRPCTIVTGYFTLSDISSATAGLAFSLKTYTYAASESYSQTGSDDYSATITSYTVTYNANGGSGAPGVQTKYYGTAIALSNAEPTKPATAVNGYTVTFNGNGGTHSKASQTAVNTITYKFSNWNTKSDGTGTSYLPGVSYTGNANITLYAIYTDSTAVGAITVATAVKDATTSTRTITFDANGGTCGITNLDSVATTTYTCKGWYTAADNGTKVADPVGSYTPSKSETIYAQWDSSTGEYASVELPVPARSGYKFIGWSDCQDAGSIVTGNYIPADTLTLYAVWEALATMFVKTNGKCKAGIPYVKISGKWKRSAAVYIKVNSKWKLSTR
jgi:uncharacterized repeat protein (TIGR02543 family)